MNKTAFTITMQRKEEGISDENENKIKRISEENEN